MTTPITHILFVAKHLMVSLTTTQPQAHAPQLLIGKKEMTTLLLFQQSLITDSK